MFFKSYPPPITDHRLPITISLPLLPDQLFHCLEMFFNSYHHRSPITDYRSPFHFLCCLINSSIASRCNLKATHHRSTITDRHFTSSVAISYLPKTYDLY